MSIKLYKSSCEWHISVVWLEWFHHVESSIDNRMNSGSLFVRLVVCSMDMLLVLGKQEEVMNSKCTVKRAQMTYICFAYVICLLIWDSQLFLPQLKDLLRVDWKRPRAYAIYFWSWILLCMYLAGLSWYNSSTYQNHGRTNTDTLKNSKDDTICL